MLKRVLTHGATGCLAGIFILHPVSMVIHDIIEHNIIHFINFKQILNTKHFPMTGYFIVIGMFMGILRAIYTHKQAKLYEKIKLLSITDELTTLFNRRYFMSQFEKEIERAYRYSRCVSLLIIDLNKFKKYNDTYGHQYGDMLLKEVALFLKNSIRKPDFVARYGGDEFVVVMPEADENRALYLAQRLYEMWESYPFTMTSRKTWKKEKVTLSIGTATFPSEAKDIEELFNKADAKLYMAKGQKIKN
jgi:diguanylate cyclase (GGDEF)-like protein